MHWRYNWSVLHTFESALIISVLPLQSFTTWVSFGVGSCFASFCTQVAHTAVNIRVGFKHRFFWLLTYADWTELFHVTEEMQNHSIPKDSKYRRGYLARSFLSGKVSAAFAHQPDSPSSHPPSIFTLLSLFPCMPLTALYLSNTDSPQY